MSRPVGIDLGAGVAALGVLAFRGPDAARFLQGQLSADIEKLAIGASTLAGLHNPQGRVVALLALARPAMDELFAVMPAELVADVSTRLRKYILRAKVRIEDVSASVRALGSPSEQANVLASIAWGGRHVVLVNASEEFTAPEGATRESWEGLDVRAGLPQVYAATTETFVSQMLNLDLLGAIAFDKGCYTGQEVVARAHYRGRVKRRLQRWRHADGEPLRPGDAAVGPDGRPLLVVRTARLESGGQEVLAVGNFSAAADEVPAPGGDGVGVRLEGPLPLPYSLPE